MTVSDASEIQLIKTGELSFNTDQQGYTDNDNFKFYQKYLASGTRRLQVLGDNTEDHNLRLAILQAGIEIQTKDFTQTNDGVAAIPGVTTSITLPSNTLGINSPSGGAFPWSLGSTPLVTLNTSASPGIGASYNWRQSYSFVDGNSYSITYTVTNLTLAAFVFLEVNFEVVNSLGVVTNIRTDAYTAGVLTSTKTITFTALDSVKFQIRVRLFDTAGFPTVSYNTIRITTITSTTTTPTIPSIPANYYLNSISFSPLDDYSLNDTCLSFKVYDKDTTPDETEIFYSDDVEFVSNSNWVNALDNGRVDIDYKSIQNFAGLIYDNSSPYFRIQLDGRFRKGRNITASKVIELTQEIGNTATSVYQKKKLSALDMPDYMHTKLCLILAHAASGSVLIDGKEISWDGEYTEKDGDRPETYPLTESECFLTIKESYKHNVT